MATLQSGSHGPEVTALKTRLTALGFDPGAINDAFDAATDAAVRAFQASRGLDPDGVVGTDTRAALNAPSAPTPVDQLTAEVIAPMFPATPLANIQANLPVVMTRLRDATLADKAMTLMALGTIRAETASFRPISEGQSTYNTSPGGHSFDLYDDRADLGNQGAPDGERFKGRGFVQLTGRANYKQHGEAIGLGAQLIDNPDLANDPDIAAKLLASFLKAKEPRIRQALEAGDLATARRLVNGGSHGLADFTDAYRIGDRIIA